MWALYFLCLCEAAYAAHRRRRLGLDSCTTPRWAASTFLSGLFLLRLLPSEPRENKKL